MSGAAVGQWRPASTCSAWLDDLGDQAGRGYESLDGTHSLAGRIALTVGIDTGGVLAAAQVEGAIVHRSTRAGPGTG